MVLVTMEKQRLVVASLVTVVGLCLRSSLSLHSFSGKIQIETNLDTPMYGDYEAQRHWQEITVNIPVSQWYTNTPDNDLQYWGLDYPPLTAYHSLINGIVARKLNSSYVELKTSRGISTEDHKYFMRLTVLVLDALLYLPCVYYAIRQIQKRFLIRSEQNLIAYLVAAIYPAQILIDNGHFQYNNVSLGLAMLSIGLMISGKYCWGSFAFTLALNYKQMELYHSLPIFFFLLAQCLPGLAIQTNLKFSNGLLRLIKIGTTVVVATILLYLPWLSRQEDILQVLHRLFPIARGVFEDKVANFWCIANVFHKIKENYTNEQMAKMCLITTLIAALPSNIYLFFKATVKNFLQSLIITSLAFFLFSFQVHEKTILLVSAPVLLLLPVTKEKKWLILLLQTATFSMTPLLRKDGLIVAYFALSVVFVFSLVLLNEFYRTNTNDAAPADTWEKFKVFVCISSMLVQCVLVMCLVLVTPPQRYPHLFELLISAFSAGHFLLYFGYFYVQQFFVKSLIVE